MTYAIGRRAALVRLAGSGVVAFQGNCTRAAEDHPKGVEQSLERLRDGNARFVEGKTRHAHASADWRKQLLAGQQPFATILGCSDSRVPTELVFDQGFGDLFVIRVAGNVIAPDVIGSVEYAVEHLRTSLVVVLGHEGCGAVTAALKAVDNPTKELPGVTALVKMIEPALPKAQPNETFEKRVSAAVEANVRWSIKQLASLAEAKRPISDGKFRLVGAVYDLATGRVRFLS